MGRKKLRIDDVELRATGPGEVRLRVEAIGLNRSEAMFRAGNYPVKPALPTLIGYEGVGVIKELGTGVTGFAVGDRVCVVPNYRLGEYGMYAEETVVPATSLLKAPAGLLAGRGIGLVDAVLHGHGDRRAGPGAGDGWRLRDHSRGLEQRGSRGNSARELGRRCVDRGDPSE